MACIGHQRFPTGTSLGDPVRETQRRRPACSNQHPFSANRNNTTPDEPATRANTHDAHCTTTNSFSKIPRLDHEPQPEAPSGTDDSETTVPSHTDNPTSTSLAAAEEPYSSSLGFSELPGFDPSDLESPDRAAIPVHRAASVETVDGGISPADSYDKPIETPKSASLRHEQAMLVAHRQPPPHTLIEPERAASKAAHAGCDKFDAAYASRAFWRTRPLLQFGQQQLDSPEVQVEHHGVTGRDDRSSEVVLEEIYGTVSTSPDPSTDTTARLRSPGRYVVVEGNASPRPDDRSTSPSTSEGPSSTPSPGQEAVVRHLEQHLLLPGDGKESFGEKRKRSQALFPGTPFSGEEVSSSPRLSSDGSPEPSWVQIISESPEDWSFQPPGSTKSQREQAASQIPEDWLYQHEDFPGRDLPPAHEIIGPLRAPSALSGRLLQPKSSPFSRGKNRGLQPPPRPVLDPNHRVLAANLASYNARLKEGDVKLSIEDRLASYEGFNHWSDYGLCFDEAEVEETDENRKAKAKACVRCRFQKQRCLPDESDPDGPCLPCKSFSKTSRKTIHRTPCFRKKISDVVLHRRGGLGLTRRWDGVELKDIRDRILSDRVRLIAFTSEVCEVPIEVEVVRFIPQKGDILNRYWTTLEDNKIVRQGKQLAPFCLVDIHSAAADFEKYLNKYWERAFLTRASQCPVNDDRVPGMVGNEDLVMDDLSHDNNSDGISPRQTEDSHQIDIIHEAHRVAYIHYKDMPDKVKETENSNMESNKEKQMLQALFKLWFANRHTRGSSYICSEDTLGMRPVDEPGYPLPGKVSLPRMILAQFDSITYSKGLHVHGGTFIREMESMMTKNHRKYWFTTYISLFILLSEASWVTRDRYRHARQLYGGSVRYSIPQFVEELQEGCNIMLMHWHYYNCRPYPDPDKPKENQKSFLANLTDLQYNLVMKTMRSPEIERHLKIFRDERESNGDVASPTPPKKMHPAREYRGSQDKMDWDEPYYWVAQMFEEDWQPHKTYMREKEPRRASTPDFEEEDVQMKEDEDKEEMRDDYDCPMSNTEFVGVPDDDAVAQRTKLSSNATTPIPTNSPQPEPSEANFPWLHDDRDISEGEREWMEQSDDEETSTRPTPFSQDSYLDFNSNTSNTSNTPPSAMSTGASGEVRKRPRFGGAPLKEEWGEYVFAQGARKISE